MSTLLSSILNLTQINNGRLMKLRFVVSSKSKFPGQSLSKNSLSTNYLDISTKTMKFVIFCRAAVSSMFAVRFIIDLI
jgi:hypothetical protein